jgi:hypothetical protein
MPSIKYDYCHMQIEEAVKIKFKRQKNDLGA